eukprot:7142367-Lingulodinium_polyedra.AAC.1
MPPITVQNVLKPAISRAEPLWGDIEQAVPFLWCGSLRRCASPMWMPSRMISSASTTMSVSRQSSWFGPGRSICANVVAPVGRAAAKNRARQFEDMVAA